jgi:hypothetical protein
MKRIWLFAGTIFCCADASPVEKTKARVKAQDHKDHKGNLVMVMVGLR